MAIHLLDFPGVPSSSLPLARDHTVAFLMPVGCTAHKPGKFVSAEWLPMSNMQLCHMLMLADMSGRGCIDLS